MSSPDATRPVPVPVQLAMMAWGRRDADRRALLVHGLGSTSAEWWQIAEGLARAGYRVVAPDLRGHGGSPMTSSYRIDELVSDLHELGTGWDLLIGHSFGGLLAAAACAGGAEFAHRVVLIDPVLDVPDEMREQVIQAQLNEHGSTAGVEELLAANPRWHPQDAVSRVHFTQTANLYAVEHWMRDNAPLHRAEQALALSVPTVILGADPDRGAYVPVELGQHLAAANPFITYEIVTGAGHAIYRDDPGAVLNAAGAGSPESGRGPAPGTGR